MLSSRALHAVARGGACAPRRALQLQVARGPAQLSRRAARTPQRQPLALPLRRAFTDGSGAESSGARARGREAAGAAAAYAKAGGKAAGGAALTAAKFAGGKFGGAVDVLFQRNKRLVLGLCAGGAVIVVWRFMFNVAGKFVHLAHDMAEYAMLVVVVVVVLVLLVLVLLVLVLLVLLLLLVLPLTQLAAQVRDAGVRADGGAVRCVLLVLVLALVLVLVRVLVVLLTSSARRRLADLAALPFLQPGTARLLLLLFLVLRLPPLLLTRSLSLP